MRTAIGVAAGGMLAALALHQGTESLAAPLPRREPVDFAREIWPILEANCIDCHGVVKRRGGLRLDMHSALLRGGKNGPAIVVGKSSESLLMRRVRGEGNEQAMPLDMDPLTEDQIAILAAWIDEGASWPAGIGEADADTQEAKHWAYVPPVRPGVLGVTRPEWVRTPIDAFVLARLESTGRTPSPEAPRAELLRRVTLDLTGLPPTTESLEAFEQDESPDAYERAVNRLLNSPAYGERWARPWLDLARYADSRGYEKDQTWSHWPYRDWVIRALNDDMPFDRFTIEQLAGDLLPGATQDQLIATGFHRCAMINEEGGVDPEEARVVSVVDRTDTTSTVWLGSTVGCARCHDHKFDPVSAKEYYSLFAFFNNSPIETHFVGDGETRVQSEMIVVPRADEQSLLARQGVLRERLEAGSGGEDEAALRVVESLLAQRPTAQVMKELPEPRETRVMERGHFLTPGDVVLPDVPHAMGVMSVPPGRDRDRRALAEWIVARENPLTARVHVNRVWAGHFGRGLVETEEDFGTRGSLPSHPELLDWLAVDFMESGWSQKHLHRLIVTSAVYRQSSVVSREAIEQDPANELLGRWARRRLDAEAIRDQALSLGGLLSRTMGGPSVMPPQPAGVWSTPYSGETWKESDGEDRYRRAIYTFWKRASPYPSFVAFDAPSRQVTCTRRSTTNTPLQALVLLNDPVYIEAARGLALRALAREGDDASRVSWAFRECTARRPDDAELARLVSLLQQQRTGFAADSQAAAAMAGRDASARRSGANEQDLAAWTVVGNVLLNLDEVVVR